MKDKSLDIYLNKLDKALEGLDASQRSELILEIKSHILEKAEASKKKIPEILKEFGTAELFAKRFLKEKNVVIPEKAKRNENWVSGITKWISISFMSLLGFILLLIIIAIVFFTPIVEMNSDGMKVFGGAISLKSKNKSEKKDKLGKDVLAHSIANFEKTLVIKNTSGDIMVEGIKGLQKVEIKYNEAMYSDEKCEIKNWETKEATLFEVSTKKSSYWEEGCHLDLTIKVPIKDINYVLSAGSGDLVFNNISGWIKAETGSGKVSGQGDFKVLDVETGSGDVTLIQTKTLHKKAVWSIDTGSGDARVFMPKDTKINWFIDTGSGDSESDFKQESTAEAKIEIDTGSGDAFLKIKK
ncbi:MAG: DUF1700 domain-containing protein [Alphaproteobacteria bacterium]|nr:DUF1700 domain-containing protein [Alphaproteobacteria bacterium]